MLSKIALFVACLYLVQASAIGDSEHQADDVTNYAEAVLSRQRRSCGAGECNAHCKKLGHARGVCIGTYCQCRSRLRRSPAEEAAENNQNKEVKEDDKALVNNNEENAKSDSDVSFVADAIKSRSTRGTCEYNECNRFCRKLGHARGVCIGTYCQCRFRRRRSVPQEIQVLQEQKSTDVTNFSDKVLSRQRRSCGAWECNQHCKKMGYVRGVCIGTYCQCRSR